jgi:hypothetical protein
MSEKFPEADLVRPKHVATKYVLNGILKQREAERFLLY